MGRSWMGTSLFTAAVAVTGTTGMPCGGASRELQAKDIKDNKDTISAREIWADNLRLRDKKTSCGYPNQFTLIFRTSDAICNECKTSAQESSMIAPSNLTQEGIGPAAGVLGRFRRLPGRRRLRLCFRSQKPHPWSQARSEVSLACFCRGRSTTPRPAIRRLIR